MHPAATRSIRIENTAAPPSVMLDVFRQYSELIGSRTQQVRNRAGGRTVDMRIGWLLWENGLTEFLYFEERMQPPDPNLFYAEWNDTSARGVRKASRSLWIFEKATNLKRYSVTTSAGAKIQPYFDIPPPSDPNLYYFRVQSEPYGADTVLLWITKATAQALEQRVGALTRDAVSEAILALANRGVGSIVPADSDYELAVAVQISTEAHSALLSMSKNAKSDEHRVQMLVGAIS